MVATAAAIIGAGAAAGGLGLGIMNAGSANDQANRQYALQLYQLQQAQQNEQYQRAVQAMVNQRAVAGTSDSFGTTTQYDPNTNTWVQKLGPLPLQGDIAAINANRVRDSVDMANQELVNRIAMQRAAEAGPAADAARRQLENFRPISSDALTGLLTQQGVEAARQAYDPLRADTLRAVARTGTAAGPVLRQLGLGEAQNLRNTLIDAQIQGLTQAPGINNANYTRLANAAGTTQALATPTLGQGQLGSSSADQLLAQLTAQRAQWAPSSTAQGAMGANQSVFGANQATAGTQYPGQVTVGNQIQSGLKDLASYANATGPNSLTNLISKVGGLFGSSGYDPQAAGYNADASGTGGQALQSMGFFNPLYDPSQYSGGSASNAGGMQ